MYTFCICSTNVLHNICFFLSFGWINSSLFELHTLTYEHHVVIWTINLHQLHEVVLVVFSLYAFRQIGIVSVHLIEQLKWHEEKLYLSKILKIHRKYDSLISLFTHFKWFVISKLMSKTIPCLLKNTVYIVNLSVKVYQWPVQNKV